jgi:nitroreductase
MTSDRTEAEDLAAAAAAAGLAPSVHNTQPWRWRVGPDRLDLYADRSRQLPATDPTGRLLMLSCGAALHHARVAMAAEGWTAAVALFPSRDDPDHIARVVRGARVGVRPEAMRLFQAVRTRHTDRRPVADVPVPTSALAAIRRAVETERAHLHLLRPEQVSELAVVEAHAEEVTALDPARHAEIGFWVGGDRGAGTGIPDAALPDRTPQTDVPLRDFGRRGDLPAGSGHDRAARYAVIFGEEDTPVAWVRAGAALSAAWLTATEHGLSVLPFSAVVEVGGARAALRRMLAGLGHPYLVLRLGVADSDHPGPPHTPRLDAAQTVEIVGGGR